MPLIGTWATTFWGLGVATVLLVPTIALLAHRTAWGDVGVDGWLAVAYMAVVSSLIGYVLWFWALGHGGIAHIASWQLGQPLITVLLAALLLGEPVTAALVLSGAAIVVGTALTQWRRGSRV